MSHKPIPLPDLDEAVIEYGHACRMEGRGGWTTERDAARRKAFKRVQRAVRERDAAHEAEKRALEAEIERLEVRLERLERGVSA